MVNETSCVKFVYLYRSLVVVIFSKMNNSCKKCFSVHPCRVHSKCRVKLGTTTAWGPAQCPECRHALLTALLGKPMGKFQPWIKAHRNWTAGKKTKGEALFATSYEADVFGYLVGESTEGETPCCIGPDRLTNFRVLFKNLTNPIHLPLPSQ